VVYNEDVCIGCRYCLVACPFYMPTFEYSKAFDPRVQKCSMCYARTTKGEVPACAAECPLEAITFGDRDELIKLARDRIKSHPNDYVDHIYGEHELGGTPSPSKSSTSRRTWGRTRFPSAPATSCRWFLSSLLPGRPCSVAATCCHASGRTCPGSS
jgi:Fe-S-cluster-containing dehydrogenase component